MFGWKWERPLTTVKYAAISAASSGNNTLVSAVTGKKIRVLALFAKADATVAMRLESAADGTALTGVMDMNPAESAGLIVLPFNPVGWVETIAGELLNLELGGAVQVSGGLVYQEVQA